MSTRSQTDDESLEWRKRGASELQSRLWQVGALLTAALSTDSPREFDDKLEEAADAAEQLADALRGLWG